MFDLHAHQRHRVLLGCEVRHLGAKPPTVWTRSGGQTACGAGAKFCSCNGTLRIAAILKDPASGRTLEVRSDQPGVQVYMGNFLDGTLRGKANAVYGPNGGLCLETQKHPDSINHPDWPSVRLDPGTTYRHVMVHRFTR